MGQLRATVRAVSTSGIVRSRGIAMRRPLTSILDKTAVNKDQPIRLRWQTANEAPPLAESELHVWRLPLALGEEQTDADDLSILSPGQLGRMQRLIQPLHRRRYARTQAGCRRILAQYVGVDAGSLAFRYGPAGKPAIDRDGPVPEFNLTTSGDLALLAVSATQPVGIDCELERARPQMLAIADQMFGADVRSALAELTGAALQRAFHLHWTALEARVKADGRGLTRREDPDPDGLMVAHALAGDIDGRIALCAVARRSLPAPDQWRAMQLAID